MLVIGLVLSSRAWWAALHQHASLWTIAGKTAEILVMAVGLLLILIIPVFQHESIERSGASRTGRRSEPDCGVATDKDGPLMTL